MQNSHMETRLGHIEVTYRARGNPTYTLDLWHDGLKKHRLLRGDSQSIVQLKAQLQADEWQEKWDDVEHRRSQRSERSLGKQQLEERKSEAADRTADAQEQLRSLASLLHETLKVDDRVDWDTLKNRAEFPEPKPKPVTIPAEPLLATLLREPRRTDAKYQPKLSFFDKLMTSRKKRMEQECASAFASDIDAWTQSVLELRRSHSAAVKARAQIVRDLRSVHDHEGEVWQAKKTAYETAQASANASVDAKRVAYKAAERDAIVEYMDLVLSASRYPEYFPQEFDIDYDTAAKTVIVDYQLPGPDDLPTLKAVRYVASRDEFEEQFITEMQAARQYDDALYQTVLRTVHELFESDVINALDAVVVNGIVTAIDRTTGKPVTACVLSLRAGRTEISSINLAHVDPRSCFKSLKGVGSSKLHGLSPVPPIMPLRREDGRFVSAYEVANTLDGSVNLAAMDWEDFEHLIREVFEKEFSSTGGEVRVTQASRDGGVDAVAFDPDPIRGGKIVIQAKRYTNTVGVSAVRDLYGTVLNEGATKGVLVTTSDYGPDSYAFANGKPLVLLSGANLLHMLAKHGYSARIDIREAKRLASKV